MKNKKKYIDSWSFILIVIYTIYYFCMRNTARVLTYLDTITCTFVGITCSIAILYNLILWIKHKKNNF